MEEHKENTRIAAVKSLVLSKTESHSRRMSRRIDPTRASRSVSCARSPSPSPSQKLDKMPTKADFQVSGQITPAPLCAPVSDHARGRAGPSVAQEDSGPVHPTHTAGPLSGPGIAKAPVGTLGDADSGLPLTPTSCLPEALPAAAPIVLSSDAIPDVVMAPAAPLGDACPSSARPASGPDVTLAGSVHAPKAPLVERYQSVTPSPTPPAAPETMEDRLVHLLGLQITASLAPIQSSVADIGNRLRVVEEGGAAWGSDDAVSLGLGGYDKGYDDDIPLGGEEHVDYHIASAPSRTMAEDTEMEDAQKRFKSHDSNEDPPPYFEYVILNACNQTHNEIDPAQLTTLSDMAALDWDDFCSSMFLDRLRLPPPLSLAMLSLRAHV